MDRRPPINISAIPVAGVGGAGLLVVALSMAAEFPEVRWLLAGGFLGGILVAVALGLTHRSRRPDSH
jgi:hypothetical protein